MFLSIWLATAPTSVTCPLSTMMWMGGTGCKAYRQTPDGRRWPGRWPGGCVIIERRRQHLDLVHYALHPFNPLHHILGVGLERRPHHLAISVTWYPFTL